MGSQAHMLLDANRAIEKKQANLEEKDQQRIGHVDKAAILM